MANKSISIQNHSANIACGDYSILIGHGSTGPAYSVGFGRNCVPGNTGRVAFNNVEPFIGATGSIDYITGLIPIQWNNALYHLPLLSSTSTDIKTKMDMMALGELYYSNSTGTATSGINTAGGVSLSGTPTMSLESTSNYMSNAYFDAPANGRLRYKGMMTNKFHCALSLSGFVSSPNQDLSFWIKKNGIIEAKSVSYFTNPSGGNSFTVAFHAVVSMATNDYIEVWGENTTGANEMTIRSINLVAMGDGGEV